MSILRHDAITLTKNALNVQKFVTRSYEKCLMTWSLIVETEQNAILFATLTPKSTTENCWSQNWHFNLNDLRLIYDSITRELSNSLIL